MHLLFDLFGGVSEKDGRGRITGAHLGVGALQCWEKDRVEEGWLGKVQSRRHISSHAEIGVLWVSTIANEHEREGEQRE